MLAETQSRSAASRLDFQRLDLRPPESLSGGHLSAPLGDASEPFVSARRVDYSEAFTAPRRVQSAATAGLDMEVPGGANVATLRMENKVQELSRTVPREGLPLARLWETKTALLHVGLSPKGKPGLWLTQKVP